MNIESARTAALSRRRFLGTTATAGAALAITRLNREARAAVAPSDFLFKTAGQIAQMIRDREVSSVDVVKACYARIDAVNPKINAVVTVCRERALAEAQLADEALAAGKVAGPLQSVPVTVKDSFDPEGVRHTGGPLGRTESVPG